MAAFNSLATTAGGSGSKFYCKTVLLDSNLNILNERYFKYKEQEDSYYAYTYIDTLYKTKDGYKFRVINTGVDSDDYYEYNGDLSDSNIVTGSSRRNVKHKTATE